MVIKKKRPEPTRLDVLKVERSVWVTHLLTWRHATDVLHKHPLTTIYQGFHSSLGHVLVTTTKNHTVFSPRE